MRSIVLPIAILCLIISVNSASAHTSFPKEIVCPIDNTVFTVYITGSYTTFGSFKDFQKYGATGDLYESYINACPKCHYAAPISGFDTVYSASVKQEIKLILSQIKNTTIDDVAENEIAISIFKFFKAKNDQIATLYLHASYFLKNDSERIEKRKELQLNAAIYFSKAILNKEYDKPQSYPTINYLIGEMFRRTGDFRKAITYFKLSAEAAERPDWLDQVLPLQMEMAENKDDNNSI